MNIFQRAIAWLKNVFMGKSSSPSQSPKDPTLGGLSQNSSPADSKPGISQTGAVPTAPGTSGSNTLASPIYILPPLSWEKGHLEKRDWSNFLYSMIKQDVLFNVFDSAEDVEVIRPEYHKLNRDQKTAIFCELFCAMSLYESAWNQGAVGKGVDPTDGALGLLQMGVKDQAGFQTGTNYTRAALLTALPNLHVALSIMQRQLKLHKKFILTKHVDTGYFWAVILKGGTYQKIDAILKMVHDYPV